MRIWRRAPDVGSLRRQLIVLAGVGGVVVALLLAFIVQAVLETRASDAVTRVLDDRAEAVTSATTSAGDDTLVVPDARLDPGVAVYDDTGTLVAGQIPASLREPFERLATTAQRTTERVGDDYQVLARPFRLDAPTGASVHGVVVLAEPLAPYERDERHALLITGGSGALIVLVAVGLTAWATRRALAPVATMAAVAEEWSEHDLQRRFDLGAPTNEIRALGQTLDGLLDKVTRAILAEQRLTSELAHELRTPLTAIQATAELAAMRPDLDEQLVEDLADIRSAARTMAQTITGLLELARAQVVADDTCALATTLDDLVAVHGADRVQVDVPDALRVAAPAELVRRTVGPVVENAVRVAPHVRVVAAAHGRVVRLHVTDDGPGVDSDLREELFEPGRTGGSGTGLGLALARRVARSIGGDVLLSDSVGPGASFEVTLPLAPASR